MVGRSFNPFSHLSPERTLLSSRRTSVAELARRALLVLPLLVTTAGCRDTLAGFGPGIRAAANAEQLFGTLAERYSEVARNAKFDYARVQIARNALVPSNVFEDTAAWTGSSGAVRLLETQGAFANGRYALLSHSGAATPRNPADARHVTTLSKLSDNEYRWDTTVDFALGSVRPSDVATVLTRLITSAEESTEHDARANLTAVAPRSSSAMGTLFSIDSLHPTPLADGSTAVTLVIAVHSDPLKRRYPAFADYVRKYVEPAQYGFVVSDRAGVRYLEGSAKDRLLRLRLRTMRGQMVALTGAPRPMPDTLAALADFKTRIKHLGVGFHAMAMELYHVRRGDAENQWAVLSRHEPEWDLPFAAARLLRAPLRRPFAGEGSLFRIGVRADGNAPTVLIRQSRLFVQESAVLRFLNALSSTAMDDFQTKVEREENAWLRELFLALRDDARAVNRP